MSKNDVETTPFDEGRLTKFSEDIESDLNLSSDEFAFLNRVKEQVEIHRDQRQPGNFKSLVETLNNQSEQINQGVRFLDVGTVFHIGNGVATVSGLPNVSIDEIVSFPTGIEGMALNLDKKKVDLIMLGSENGIRGGDLVEATGQRLKIPVGAQLLGRIVDPLGNPLDNDKTIEASEFRYFSKVAPGVIDRTPVDESLFTGTKIIDALFPIGRGQRELIIGDRQTGKTTLAVDAILSQRKTGVRCIYVGIGQKKSSTLSVIKTIKDKGLLPNTAFVISSPDDQPALRYLAPYSGMTMAEYFLDQGMDVLIVFDDLSKHANAYRELSLLLRRPPGREAYPGDIFYIHSRLLERACKISPANGGGSITALPIAVTQNGNLTSYIPTNLISITDGQIVLDGNLFNLGQKPAIDIGRSVSRVGSKAQEPAMRELVGNYKLELSQYQEVAHFTQFGSDLDQATRLQIERGKRLLSLFKQQPNQPISFSETVVLLYALNQGFLEEIPIERSQNYEQRLLSNLKRKETKVLEDIEKETYLTSQIQTDLTRVLSEFNQQWHQTKG